MNANEHPINPVREIRLKGYDGVTRLSRLSYERLLEQMSANSMTRLMVMMASHGYLAPRNHGLAWPVHNPKLVHQVDPYAVNAQESTEFFSRVIARAKTLGIQILIELKYLGLRGIELGYPGVEFLRSSLVSNSRNGRAIASG